MKTLIWTARLLSLVGTAWSLHGFGGPTLVEWLERTAGLSLRGAATLVSLFLALLAIAWAGPNASRKPPAGGPGAREEETRDRKQDLSPDRE